MESIYQIFKEVFADKPIESFEISKDLILFVFSSTYFFSLVALMVGITTLRYLFYKENKESNSVKLISTLVSLVLIIIPIIDFLLIKVSYLEQVVEKQFLPKLTTEQVELLERRYNYYVSIGELRDKATKKQRLGLEEKTLKLNFCELSIILMLDRNKNVNKSCLWLPF